MSHEQQLSAMHQSATKNKATNYHYWRIFCDVFEKVIVDEPEARHTIEVMIEKMQPHWDFTDRENKIIVKKEWQKLIDEHPNQNDTSVIIFRKARKIFDELRSYGESMDQDDFVTHFLKTRGMNTALNRQIVLRADHDLNRMEQEIFREYEISLRLSDVPTRLGLRGYKSTNAKGKSKGKGNTKRTYMTTVDEWGEDQLITNFDDEPEYWDDEYEEETYENDEVENETDQTCFYTRNRKKRKGKRQRWKRWER